MRDQKFSLKLQRISWLKNLVESLLLEIKNDDFYTRKMINLVNEVSDFEDDFGYLGAKKSLVKGLKSIIDKSYNYDAQKLKKKFNAPALKTCLSSIARKIDDRILEFSKQKDDFVKNEEFKKIDFTKNNRDIIETNFDKKISLNFDEIELLGYVSLYLKENSQDLRDKFLDMMSQKIKESRKIDRNNYHELVLNYVFDSFGQDSNFVANEVYDDVINMVIDVNKRLREEFVDFKDKVTDIKEEFTKTDNKFDQVESFEEIIAEEDIESDYSNQNSFESKENLEWLEDLVDDNNFSYSPDHKTSKENEFLDEIKIREYVSLNSVLNQRASAISDLIKDYEEIKNSRENSNSLDKESFIKVIYS